MSYYDHELVKCTEKQLELEKLKKAFDEFGVDHLVLSDSRLGWLSYLPNNIVTSIIIQLVPFPSRIIVCKAIFQIVRVNYHIAFPITIRKHCLWPAHGFMHRLTLFAKRNDLTLQWYDMKNIITSEVKNYMEKFPYRELGFSFYYQGHHLSLRFTIQYGFIFQYSIKNQGYRIITLYPTTRKVTTMYHHEHEINNLPNVTSLKSEKYLATPLKCKTGTVFLPVFNRPVPKVEMRKCVKLLKKRAFPGVSKWEDISNLAGEEQATSFIVNHSKYASAD